MANLETIDIIRVAVEAIEKMLALSTGLPEMERKIVAYYTLATHSLENTDTFPLLVISGPMGTGKSQTLQIVKAFCYRPKTLTPRGYTPPALRDEFAECCGGTAIIEEGDGSWRDHQSYEALISDRYQRESAKAAYKVPAGDNSWDLVTKFYYGATVLHRRTRFHDLALEGRSITVNTKPVHGRTYKDFPEKDPMVLDLKKTLEKFTFSPPQLKRSFEGAGRILASFRPILALAEWCGDEEFLKKVEQWLEKKTGQLKDDQSAEPEGLVVRALVERLSTSGGLVFHYVKMKDLKASIFANAGEDLAPHQIGALARELGFQTKNSHGFGVVVPTPQLLVAACDRVGYDDEEIAKLRDHLANIGRDSERR
jgi:hypothetical protein